jgi:uncharacterized protein YndB with AHSA1/START domain
VIEVTHTLDLAAPIETVFAFIADPRNDPLWNGEVRETVLDLEAEVAVGTRFVTRARFMGRTFDTELEVTEFGESHVYASRAPFRSGSFRSPLGLLFSRQRDSYRPIEPGKCGVLQLCRLGGVEDGQTVVSKPTSGG